MRQVFISYDRDDAIVRQVTRILKNLGMRVAVVNLMHTYPTDLRSRTLEAFRHFDIGLIILSQHYCDSAWHRDEERLALIDHNPQVGNRFLAVLQVDGCSAELYATLRIPIIKVGRAMDDGTLRDGIEQAIRQLGHGTEAFVILKSNDPEIHKVYRGTVRPLLKEFGYNEPILVDGAERLEMITEQIEDGIRRSDLIYADLTGERPNCYYEVGYAHGLGREVILAIKKSERPHFDVSQYPFIDWSDPKELKRKLRARLKAIRERAAITPSTTAASNASPVAPAGPPPATNAGSSPGKSTPAAPPPIGLPNPLATHLGIPPMADQHVAEGVPSLHNNPDADTQQPPTGL